jgi:hypothetical protein
MRKLLLLTACLEMLALAIWVGALIGIIAAVIPAVFNTTGIETGGRILTRTFHGYDRLVLASGGILVLSAFARRWFEQGMDGFGMGEFLLLGVMVAVALFLTFYLNPETVRLQDAAFAAKDELEKKSAYDVFFQYHWLARGLYLLNLGLAIVLMCVKVRKWAR